MSKEKLQREGMDEMDGMFKKDYAEFMEKTLERMGELPVEGICIVAKLSGRAIFADYYNSNMMDKFIYAGVVQQSANMDMLRANNWIKDDSGK